jgi:RNA polymerase sigma factor
MFSGVILMWYNNIYNIFNREKWHTVQNMEHFMVDEIENVASLDNRAVIAKLSDDDTNRLIADFVPFLHACVTKYSIQNNVYHRQEMFSAALRAFAEAIHQYNIEKGHFFPFANRIVRERIIDCVRSIYRHDEKTVPLVESNTATEEDPQRLHTVLTTEEEISIRIYDAERNQELLVAEIEQLKSELATWGITLDSLHKQSPKHKRLRETCKYVVSTIAQMPDITQTIQIKRYFPISTISKITGIPQKTLERARIFILASLIIKLGDYEYLSAYVDNRRAQP